MPAQTRKRTVKAKTGAASGTTATRRRGTTRAAVRRNGRKSSGNSNFVNFFVPLFFILCIVFCLGFLGLMGYRTATASEFFEVKKIDVRGAAHSSKSDIEKIVEAQTLRAGVWNADLGAIQEQVEKLAYVKSAAVSRVLPDGVRVNVIERVPKAVVRVEGADFWADDEGRLLGLVGEKEERPPFYIRGWDMAKTEEAVKENQLRVKTFQKMLEDWRSFDLAGRVSSVDMSDLRSPQAIVQDASGTRTIVLPKDNFAKKLQTGLENLANKGDEVGGIDVSDVSPRLIYRERAKN